MKLKVRYFGGVRERLGRDFDEVAVTVCGEDGARVTVGALWEALLELHPQLERMRGFVRVAVNLDFAEDATILNPDDEIALIPPVSGGAGSGASGDPEERSDPSGAFRVTRAPLDSEVVRHLVLRPDAGAVLVFQGVVRDHTGARKVSHLEYDIYLEMALQKLIECAGEVHERWHDIQIAIHHRWGRLEIGEEAVVIAVSSPHRANAFRACEYAIDRLKEIVPVWKKEVSPDGEEWIGMGP